MALSAIASFQSVCYDKSNSGMACSLIPTHTLCIPHMHLHEVGQKLIGSVKIVVKIHCFNRTGGKTSSEKQQTSNSSYNSNT